MATRPTSDPTWATGGSAVKINPTTAKREIGWTNGEKPPAGFWNYTQNSVGDWIEYLDESAASGAFGFGNDGALVFEGRIANCPAHLTSDVGHELANQSGTFGLCWSMTKDGAVACSLRSNGEYDVSAIAKLYGGGGHKNAAGFETDMATLLRWMR